MHSSISKTLALLFLFIIGCGSNAVKPVESKPPFESLNSAQCAPGYLRGLGIGASEGEALNAARSELAKQIYSSVKVSETFSQNQHVSDGQEISTSDYESESYVEAVLLNAHDAHTLRVEHDADRTGIVVCMSRADAAKGFAEKQKLIADSLDMHCRLVSEQPRQKDEIWRKTQALWKEFANMQWLLQGLDAANADLFNSISQAYSKAREERIAYCTAKLHWNPEQNNEYSETAFSKLSAGVKIEKSPCEGGISLVYKGAEECTEKFGLSNCVYRQSLSVSSCEGKEYLLLSNEFIGAHQKPEFAIEKLKSNFKSSYSWDKWIADIKEWSPQCK